MNTLIQAPVSTVLEQLFADADASQAHLMQQMAGLSPEDRATLMASARSTDYRAFYTRAKEFHLAVSRKTGALLYMYARMTKARSVVEFGTSFGVSTLHLAAALRDNGGGALISAEFEPSKVAAARRNIESAGLSDLVEVREGDALETLADGLPESIDLVLLDGAKALYPGVLALLEPRLHAGSVLVADNADWSPEYLEIVRSGGRYVSQALHEDLEVSVKL
ncbi:MAG: class I SAM-dependent methyltransferase [Pseudomonadota bacterium]|uniref:O-methyltransferase n=1 Tax=Caballeronia sordidicola TaxID=196367 RepID=A0A242MHZ4_CABSO|nr:MULTISPECIES: class I SAM-dependent methyltransferase [Burkholderiaceae]AMH42860.1 methyltransferase [Burkholderia sp. PAMC 26561]AMM16173.1 methyltransferase [Burkholderia sp. PAMC 28687]MDP9152802.1 class I SAM-dependent methyltransferase [Pseudomonadota bacterium]OTP70360.1 O-methyltransferase [Caballeronia sordidicola]